MKRNRSDFDGKHHDSSACAAELVEHLRAGGELVPWQAPTLRLDAGEVQYAQLAAFGSRFYGLDDAVWDHRMFVAGGLVMAGVTAAASVLANSARKRAAATAAVAQWRPLGWMPTVVTSHRLLVCHHGTWQSVWYSGIRQLIPERDSASLQILFESDPPYRLSGPDAAFLAVMLLKLVNGEILNVDLRNGFITTTAPV